MSLADRLWISVRVAPMISLGHALWYAILAGAASLLFFVLLRRRALRKKISPKSATLAQVGREVVHSARSLIVFGVMGGLVVFAALSGWTRFYRPVDEFGWPYFFISIVLMIVIHDAYFYWTHRLMHHPRIFRAVHRTHHLSINPTPWAAYSFSTVEAFVQAGISPLIAFVMPTHPTAFSVFMMWQISFNVLGHCGYEIFPHWFLQSWLGQLFNTPTHHAMHHESNRTNFGLYFNVWDRLFGTNHHHYAERFAHVTGAAVVTPDAAPHAGQLTAWQG